MQLSLYPADALSLVIFVSVLVALTFGFGTKPPRDDSQDADVLPDTESPSSEAPRGTDGKSG
jgi:hypothetical protein